MGDLAGRRVLVVGASKGIGRGVALRLDRDGAQIAVAARRVDLLEELAAECSAPPVVMQCDVRDEESCRSTVETAAAAMGGIDVLVYAAGMGVVSSLAKASQKDWASAFEVNVVGASLTTAAAVPHLAASHGVAIYFSSVAAHLTPPWKGMGVYLACKTALEKAVQVWTLEEPAVRFTTLVVGSTSGGSFFADAVVRDSADVAAFRDEWHARGYLATEQLTPDDQAQAVVDVIQSRAQIDTAWVRPRSIMQLPPA